MMSVVLFCWGHDMGVDIVVARNIAMIHIYVLAPSGGSKHEGTRCTVGYPLVRSGLAARRLI